MNDMENLLNGYIFTTDRGIYRLPPELLQILFNHFDHETLLNCQLVCKSWLEDIRNYVWRKKAETKFGKKLLRYNFSWMILCCMCMTENPFEKNLLKNHSGENGFQDWITYQRDWTVENPPVGAPELPVDEDPIFEGKQFCFATSQGRKYQVVDLTSEGFHPHILYELQLSMEISEWYCGPKDVPYKQIEYDLGYTDILPQRGNLLLKAKDVEQENKWIKKTYNIECEEKGLGVILFTNHVNHLNLQPRRNCKIAGSCLKVKFPCIAANSSDSSNDL